MFFLKLIHKLDIHILIGAIIFNKLFLLQMNKYILPKIYIQINTWAFPYWPGYHPETPIWVER